MNRDAGPTGRALQTLDLLQAEPGLTAERLATQLGVSDRAARRYIAMLRESDIPIESVRGRYGGYRVGRGLRPAPLRFTAGEALGLVMAVLDGHHAAADSTDLVGSALGKIIRALPEKVGDQAATMRRHASAAPDRGAARPDPEISMALVEAIAGSCRVGIRYHSEAGHEWNEDVDPWAVVVRHGRWYLVCHSHRAHAVRAYRVDRVRSVSNRQESFRPPEEDDYVDLLERHLGVGWEFEARVLFDAPVEQVSRYVTPIMGRLQPLDGGTRCRLLGTTSNPQVYAGEWLAPIPVPFRVESGNELRQAVAAVGTRMLAAIE